MFARLNAFVPLPCVIDATRGVSGGVATVRGITLYVPVRRIVFDAVRYLPACDTVKLVERVVHQVIVAPVVPQRLNSVVLVVLVLCLMRPVSVSIVISS